MPPKSPCSEAIVRNRYGCDQCGRTYSRRDHLVRHLQTHTAERPFICTHCGKGFARGDLLVRHSAIHAPESSSPGVGPQHRRGKANRACRDCAKAKSKCQDRKPCRRCVKRGIICTQDSMTTSPSHTPLGHFAAEAGFQSQTEVRRSVPRDMSAVCDQPLLDVDHPPVMGESLSDLSWYLPESFFIQPQHTLDVFQPDISSQMEPRLAATLDEMLRESFGPSVAWERLISSGRIRSASQAFEGSVWYAVPDQRSATEEHIDPDLESSSVGEESEVLAQHLYVPIPQRFNHNTRDSLLVDLVLLAQSHAPDCLRSLRRLGFPSPMLINTLVHLLLTKQDKKVDSWIHSASFRPKPTNVELTAMVIAASALNTTSPTLRRFGLDLRRLLRPVILNKLENERNTHLRLQLYQALLLSLEMDLWKDQEDCLNRAGRFSGLIATFMRQELRHRSSEMKPLPLPTDSPAEISTKWKAWITAESYARLIMRFYIYDNQLSMTLGIRTLTSPSEYRMSAPQPKELWLAKNPQEWQQAYSSQHPQLAPRVMDILASIPTISVVPGFLDRDLAMKIIFHLIGGLIAEYQLSVQAVHGSADRTESARCRKRELEASIADFDLVFNREIRHSHIGSFVVSYLSMTLNVSVSNIEILAGKAGEQESRDMYHVMKEWPATTCAREAIWHAGQVLHLFKLVDRLTSFQIIMAYHAVLVLFAYSVLANIQGHFPATGGPLTVCLNDPTSACLDSFIHMDSYEPVLRSDFRGTSREIISLLDTKQAVDVASEIILNRACSCAELSPRLVNGLVKLLKDLAAAIHVFGDDSFAPVYQAGLI